MRYLLLVVLFLPIAASAQVPLLPLAPIPSAELRLLGSNAEAEEADPLLGRLASAYRLHADVLEATAYEDSEAAGASLALVLAEIGDLMDDHAADDRFAELYRLVLSEYERQVGPVDTTTVEYAEIFAVRDQIFAALNGLDDPLEADEIGVDVAVSATSVPMTINRAVTTAMKVLLEKRPQTLSNWHARAHTYFPMIERIFEEEGVPDELKYLAMIESGLRPSVRSHASAVGMWQFTAATGGYYGLIVDGWVDERRDPEKATRAAARHLRDLYEREGDWHVAMAGYNCSPRCLNRAKRGARARGVEQPTFWDMYPFLPRETRNYVPQYIATSIMLSNPAAYGIDAPELGEPYAYELIPVRGSLALRDIADMAGVSLETIEVLNPSLRRGYLPPSAEPFPLRLPVGTSDGFLTAYASLPAEALRPPGEHIVRSGDTLSEIADTYGVSVARLRADNNLRGSLIRVGQRLVVPASEYAMPIEAAVTEAEPVTVRYGAMKDLVIYSPDAIELTLTPPDPNPVPVVRTSTRPAVPETRARIVYRVRSGDTLSEIAEAHQVRQRELRGWNSLSGSRIRVGQDLVIYSDASPTASTLPTEPVAYRVKSGDTLSGIADRYDVRVSDLREWNELSSTAIRVGQRLEIRPPDGRFQTYTVRQGDTLIHIAKRHDVAVSDLREWNALSSDRIYPGRELRIQR